MLLGFQRRQTSTEALPTGAEQGWRNMFVDEVEQVAPADPAVTWQTASNYNPLRPFNSIDHLTVAVASADRTQASSRPEHDG